MAKIKRFSVLKMAYFAGLGGFITGLIFAIVMGIFSTIVVSAWFMILLPVIYGVLGFLGGLILTPVYNLILRIINGLDLDLEIRRK